MEELKSKKGFLCDMDGVIYHGSRLLPGVKEFVDWLYRENKSFIFLTNSAAKTPQGLCEKLRKMGLDVDESHFYTSGQATAEFINTHAPGSAAYAIGGEGLMTALEKGGIPVSETNPDYVIVGEGGEFNYEKMIKAVRFVMHGAKLVGTNTDLCFPIEDGLCPGGGAVILPISAATGVKPYFVGKPNSLMVRKGLEHLGLSASEALMLGDRMDTDVLAGIEAGVDSVLLLSGVTTREDAAKFSFTPKYILNCVGDIIK